MENPPKEKSFFVVSAVGYNHPTLEEARKAAEKYCNEGNVSRIYILEAIEYFERGTPKRVYLLPNIPDARSRK
jgi:hypothetical protein